MDYTKEDFKLLRKRNIHINEINHQLSLFDKGFQAVHLVDAATTKNGILQIDKEKEKELLATYEKKHAQLHMIKMIPASGSATRMFKDLFQFMGHYQATEQEFLAFIQKKHPQSVYHFFLKLNELPFYRHLKNIIWQDQKDLDKMLNKREYQHILNYLLTSKGLNYGNTPKGLIDFHKYEDFTRTAFDEHLAESALYGHNGQTTRLHFTVSQEHLPLFKKRLKKISKIFEKKFQIRYDVTFSIQHPSTDTISIDLNGNIVRDEKGNILFRPGGHGALIHNLNKLDADLVFIKNIDNVAPDRLKEQNCKYKKMLAAILLDFQEKVFNYLKQLDKNPTQEQLQEIKEFCKEVGILLPTQTTPQTDIKYYKKILNRPIRVCGMVKNEGEPGGGPFWVSTTNHQTRLMIIEAAQIDHKDDEQQQIFHSATHFNPVDLVCGIKNYKGKKFDLIQFIDLEQGFITHKSHQGQEIKVQELPGLWNGAMANWLTLFVEVPLSTFTPVKTVFDLLRLEHQNTFKK